MDRGTGRKLRGKAGAQNPLQLSTLQGRKQRGRSAAGRKAIFRRWNKRQSDRQRSGNADGINHKNNASRSSRENLALDKMGDQTFMLAALRVMVQQLMQGRWDGQRHYGQPKGEHQAHDCQPASRIQTSSCYSQLHAVLVWQSYHGWQRGQSPKNSSLCATEVKPLTAAIRDSISRK